jgi:hypothetical protein
LNVATLPQDITAENILERLSDLTNNPDEETLVPYREFNVDGLYPWWVSLPQGTGDRRGGRILLRLPHR